VTDPVDRKTAHLDEALVAAPELEGFLRKRGHGDASRDLVQDLFVILLTKRDALDAGSPGPFRSFLFAIAYRLGANATRRRRRHAGEAPDERTLAAADPSPERAALLRENVHRAAAALDALPADVRTTLLLVADEGRSTREVAAHMNVTEEVVRARLSRGRKRLAAIMEGREVP
jgi:RNA polymerase sigma factor (sigma-70 family)